MEFDFSQVKVQAIDGTDIPAEGVYKPLANAIYRATQKLDLVDAALKINQGQSVFLVEDDVKEVRRIINDPAVGFFAFIRKALNDFLDNKGV